MLTLLQDLADALTTLVAQLEQYAVAGLAKRHARLALDHGLAVHRASLQWTKTTRATLSADPRS